MKKKKANKKLFKNNSGTPRKPLSGRSPPPFGLAVVVDTTIKSDDYISVFKSFVVTRRGPIISFRLVFEFLLLFLFSSLVRLFHAALIFLFFFFLFLCSVFWKCPLRVFPLTSAAAVHHRDSSTAGHGASRSRQRRVVAVADARHPVPVVRRTGRAARPRGER